ncbi:MAG: hypothetical protein K2I71_03785, partial [Helicobacter sp.]|nr:hypothetical protein [Helicobacter sp.]
MNYVNLNPSTNIIFINGMDNTLSQAKENMNLIQRDFPQYNVGLINNPTKGILNDISEYNSNTLTITDFLNAHILQQIFRNSKESIDSMNSKESTDTKNVVAIAHSRGVRDINNANVVNAFQGFTTTNYALLSVGSPISESELRESTASVGAKLIRQVNHP